MDKTPSGKQRVQFDFTPESLLRLDALQARTNATSKAEVVRNALRLYEWFVQEVAPTDRITITDTSGETRYRIPASALL